MDDKQIREMAAKHIDWFLYAVRPLLIDNFVHGYKHGFEDQPQPPVDEEMSELAK